MLYRFVTTPDESSGSPAPAAAAPQETPPAPAATPAAPEASIPAAPSAAQEPDIDKLVTDPALRQRLLQHPEVDRELQRQRSEAGRRARAEADAARQQLAAYQQQQAEYERQRALQQVQGLEDDEAGQLYKQQIVQQRYAEQAQTYAQQYTAYQFYQLAQSLAQRAQQLGDLTEDEQRLLADASAQPEAYIEALAELKAARKAQKLAKEFERKLAKEAEAVYQDRVGAERDSAPGVPVLPPGGPALSDKEFLAAYGRGDTSDHARARRIMSAF